MAKETAVLERELYDVKQYASELSGANERSKKEIGNLRKAVANFAELDQENAALKVALSESRAKIAALETAVGKAEAAAREGEKAVAAGKAIADALKQLALL